MREFPSDKSFVPIPLLIMLTFFDHEFPKFLEVWVLRIFALLYVCMCIHLIKRAKHLCGIIFLTDWTPPNKLKMRALAKWNIFFANNIFHPSIFNFLIIFFPFFIPLLFIVYLILKWSPVSSSWSMVKIRKESFCGMELSLFTSRKAEVFNFQKSLGERVLSNLRHKIWRRFFGLSR